MIHYWIFIDEPEKEFSSFTTVYNVKVGSSAIEQKRLQDLQQIANSDPVRYFFKIRDIKTSEFVRKIQEFGNNPIQFISLANLIRQIRLRNCQSSHR